MGIPQQITTNQVVKEMNPLSPSGFNKKQLSKQSNHQRMPKSKQQKQRIPVQKGKKIKNVRPSPLMRKKGKKSKKNVHSSYQKLHPHAPQQQQQISSPPMQYGYEQQQHPNMQMQQAMMSPQQVPLNGQNAMYLQTGMGYQRQSQSSTSAHSDYFDRSPQQQYAHQAMQMQSPPQQQMYGGYGDPTNSRAMNLNLTEQEQVLLQSINQRQQNQLNRAVQPSQRTNMTNSRRHRKK